MNLKKKRSSSNVPQDPQRVCVSCRLTKPRSQLIRIMQTATGLQVRPSKYQHGRSFYVCMTKVCQQNLRKNKRYKDLDIKID